MKILDPTPSHHPHPSEPLPPPPPRSYQQILSLPAFSFIVCCLITIINSLISCFSFDCARSSHGCRTCSRSNKPTARHPPPRLCPVQALVSCTKPTVDTPVYQSAAPQGRPRRAFPSRCSSALVLSLYTTEQHDPTPLT